GEVLHDPEDAGTCAERYVVVASLRGITSGRNVAPGSDNLRTRVRFLVIGRCYGARMDGIQNLTAAELVDGILQRQAIINVVHRDQLELMAEYGRRESFKEDGSTSMAAWITGMLAKGYETSSEEARVASALEELPAIARGYKDGSLSYDQVR